MSHRTIQTWFILGFFSLCSVLPFPLWAANTEPEWSVQTIFGPINSSMALNDYLSAILKFVYGIIGLITLIRIVLGAYKYIGAGGNPDETKAAKGTIVHALTGLIIVLIAFLLTSMFITEDFSLKL